MFTQGGKGYASYAKTGNTINFAEGDQLGFALGGLFQSVGIVFALISLFGGSSPTPDPDLPYLEQINQTTIQVSSQGLSFVNLLS
jgi:hypothetical protein